MVSTLSHDDYSRTSTALRCFLKVGPSVALVRISATFSLPLMFWTLITLLAATASLTLWQAIALCFFLRELDGRLVFNTTPWLSHRTTLGPVKICTSVCTFYMLNHSTLLARFYSIQCMGHFMGKRNYFIQVPERLETGVSTTSSGSTWLREMLSEGHPNMCAWPVFYFCSSE